MKELNKGFNHFRVNTKYTSYLIPIVKTVIAVAIIVLSITWTSLWRPDDRRVEAVISVAGLLCAFFSAYMICVSVGEMGFVAENRERSELLKRDPKGCKTKDHTSEEILTRFEESRDLELLTVIDVKYTFIGVRTSYSKSAGYHNKRFYINDSEYYDPDSFADALTEKTHSSPTIAVVSVDGKTE